MLSASNSATIKSISSFERTADPGVLLAFGVDSTLLPFTEVPRCLLLNLAGVRNGDDNDGFENFELLT